MLSVLSGLIIFLLSISLCMIYKNKYGRYDLLYWFMFFFGCFYGGAQILVGVYFDTVYTTGAISKEFAQHYSDNSAIFVMLLSSGFILSFFLYSLMLNKLKLFSGHIRFAGLVDIGLLSNSKLLFLLGLFFLLLSVLSHYLYTLPYGGFIGYIEYAAVLRSGMMDSLPPNKYSFLIAFGGFSIVSSLLFFSTYKEGFFSKIMFWIAFSFAMFVLVSKLGRISILFFISTFFVFYMFKNSSLNKMNYLYFFLLFSFSVAMLLGINSFLGRAQGVEGVIALLTKEFLFVFSNIGLVVDIDLDYRLGRDYLLSPMYMLPSSWYADFFSSVDSYNTLNYYGVRKGVAGNTSSVPVDAVTFAVYQFGMLGVFLSSFFMALTIKFFDFIVNSITHERLKLIMVSYCILFVSFLSVVYSDPAHFVGRLFPLISFFIGVFVLSSVILFLKASVRRIL